MLASAGALPQHGCEDRERQSPVRRVAPYCVLTPYLAASTGSASSQQRARRAERVEAAAGPAGRGTIGGGSTGFARSSPPRTRDTDRTRRSRQVLDESLAHPPLVLAEQHAAELAKRRSLGLDEVVSREHLGLAGDSIPMSTRIGMRPSPNASICSLEAQISLTFMLSSSPKATWTSSPGAGSHQPRPRSGPGDAAVRDDVDLLLGPQRRHVATAPEVTGPGGTSNSVALRISPNDPVPPRTMTHVNAVD